MSESEAPFAMAQVPTGPAGVVAMLDAVEKARAGQSFGFMLGRQIAGAPAPLIVMIFEGEPVAAITPALAIELAAQLEKACQEGGAGQGFETARHMAEGLRVSIRAATEVRRDVN